LAFLIVCRNACARNHQFIIKMKSKRHIDGID